MQKKKNSKQHQKASCSKLENLKMQRKMQMPKITEQKMQKKNATSNVAFSPLHFFCNLRRCIFSVAFFCNFDQLLHFFTKKNEKMQTNMQRHQNKCNRKCEKNATSNAAFSELHFFCNLRRRIFLADFVPFRNLRHWFSNLLVFGKLLQQATHSGAGKLRKISLPKKCCDKTWPWASTTYLPLIRAGKKRNSTVALF